MNRFFSFHSLWPWRSRTSGPGVVDVVTAPMVASPSPGQPGAVGNSLAASVEHEAAPERPPVGGRERLEQLVLTGVHLGLQLVGELLLRRV